MTAAQQYPTDSPLFGPGQDWENSHADANPEVKALMSLSSLIDLIPFYKVKVAGYMSKLEELLLLIREKYDKAEFSSLQLDQEFWSSLKYESYAGPGQSEATFKTLSVLIEKYNLCKFASQYYKLERAVWDIADIQLENFHKMLRVEKYEFNDTQEFKQHLKLIDQITEIIEFEEAKKVVERWS